MNNELEELLRRYQKGLDPEVAVTIVERVAGRIELYIRGNAPRDAVADIREEALVEIAYNLVNINRDATSGEIWSWCFTIAWRKIAAFFASEERREKFIQTVNPEELLQATDVAVAASWFTREEERLRAVEGVEILKKAAPECFRLLWNRYVVGMELKEMATEFSVSYDAIRVRVARCRDEAATLLAE